MLKTFKIASYKIPAFQLRIAELNKKALKLMGEAVIYTTTETVVEEIKDVGLVEFQMVTVDGPSPIINGWSIQLMIDHTNDENIVTRVGMVSSDGWFDAKADCQHCEYNRRRNFTYLLRNEKTEELKQVGKTCLKDFTGHKSPEDIARWAEIFQTFDDEIKEVERDYSEHANHRHMFTMEYLAKVVAEVEDCGGVFITKRQVEEGVHSTTTSSLALSSKIKPTKAHYDFALKAVEHTINTADGSEFSKNLCRLVRFETFDFRYSGIVAYAVGGYLRFLASEKAKLQTVSEYVGEIGTRKEFILTKLRCSVIHGDDYTLFMNVFLDEAGRTFIWSTGRDVGKDGDTMKVRGTIKDHREFKGIKQTMLSRCSILN